MKKGVIHFWQFPPEITINLEKKFRKKILNESFRYFRFSWRIEEFLKQKRDKYKVKRSSFASNLRLYKVSNNDDVYISQWIITELALVLNYDLNEIEKKIIAYRTRRGGYSIINPKLPVKVTPEFDSILCHIICDGSERITWDNATAYIQKDVNGRINFYCCVA